MAEFSPASLVMAVLVLAGATAPVLADLDASVTAAASPEVVTSVIGFAERLLSRLPESGALLLWGTGLAAASKALSRKPDASE